MGYSGRYHAASLAAVFLALAIGILIGVGLAHNVIPAAQRDLEQSLKSDLSNARGRGDTLQAELNQERDFSQQVFPSLVGGHLRGTRIAVVALGGLPDDMKGDIESVVGPNSPSGAALAEVAVVREPPDIHAIASAAPRRTPAHHLGRNLDPLGSVAHRFGRALVVGGASLDRFRGPLLSGISGRPGGIDGVIVVRSEPTDMSQNESAAAGTLEAGILSGLAHAGGTPVVGVERSDSETSSIGFFDAQGLPATVDSIDLVSGQVALAYALAGTQGNYGVKGTADRFLPALGRVSPPAPSPVP